MKIPHKTWVLAMDGSKMMLLQNRGDTIRPKLETVAQQEADNPRSAFQGTDRPGRSFSSASPRRSSMQETDLHEEAKRDFAQETVRLLDAHQKEHGGDVIVLAAPSILGDFRKHCPDQLRPAIMAEIGKDVVNHPPEKIVAIIDAVER